MRSFLLSPAGAAAIATITTLVAALESTVMPWSPFLILYAIALPAFPLLLGGVPFGSFTETFQAHAWPIAGIGLLMLAWETVIADYLYENHLLRAAGRAGIAGWSPAATLDLLLNRVSVRTGWSAGKVNTAYGVYFLLWAPVAEELFFWGYLYPSLRPEWGAWSAALITSSFFGARHALHFLYLRSPFPWPAAAAFAATTTVSGLLNSWLLEVTQSLWPLILLHLLSNVAASCRQAFRSQ